MECEESPSAFQGEAFRFPSTIEKLILEKIDNSNQTVSLDCQNYESYQFIPHQKDSAPVFCTASKEVYDGSENADGVISDWENNQELDNKILDSLNATEISSLASHASSDNLKRPETVEGMFSVNPKTELKVSKPAAHGRIVYVWDLDETLIIFQTLSTCKFAEAYKGYKDVKQGIKLGRKWESLIIRVCDEFCFYEQVEDYNEPNIGALSQYDDGANLINYDFNADEIEPPFTDSEWRKLAYRHRWIKNIYSQGLEKLLKDETLQEWNELYEATDYYTNGWLSAGRSLLEECLKSSQSGPCETVSTGSLTGMTGHEDVCVDQKAHNCNINVVVTSGTLVPSLVKCLLFRLNAFIDSVNVYSSREVGKLQCFRWIKERYEAPNVKFCAVGDGLDECEAAENLSWPFVKVELRPESPHSLLKLTSAAMKQYISVVYGDTEE